MRYLFILILAVLTVALVLYLQLRPHKDGLDEKHRQYYDWGDKIFGPLLKLAGGAAKPYKVGPNTKVDLAPAVLIAIFALLNLLILVR